MEMDLKTYLKQNYNNIIWKERDLHSGNILYSGKISQGFYISNLRFCRPVNKPLNGVYGNLPYIAPEVITGKKTTYASDIYSIGILMWEISSEQLPFINYEHNYELAMKIINGMRPKIVPDTPLEYKKLMEQCWDADSTKRPNICTLRKEVQKFLLKFQNYQDDSQKQIISDQHQQLSNSTDPTNINYTSKIYQFENFPEPKNATEVMQDDHKKEIEQQTKKHSLDINDDDEKQDDLEISGDVSKKIRTS
ncbi:kinase-like domain-containing protein [Rhizophagus diaphanus]|nr:kinase-like domain-containing protein [Rhizophagus diaphanus] [Rhizophagus sp. MUCL 43196]